MIAIAADDGNSIEVICNLAVEKIGGKRDIHCFFFPTACMSIALEEIEASYAPIGRYEHSPTVQPWLARRRRSVEPRV